MRRAAGVTPGWLGLLAAIARAWFGYPLTVSHVSSFGTKKKERRRTARSLADAGIGVVVLPRSAPGWPGAVVPGSSPGPAVVRELLADQS